MIIVITGGLAGGAAALITIDSACVSDWFNESVTFTVKLKVPWVVGVPEMFTLDPVVGGPIARPGGSDPTEILQVRVPLPPVDVNG